MNRKQSRNGVSAVEFALISPILFMSIFAGIEFVRANIVRHTASNATYAAARAVIVPGATKAEAIQKAQDVLAIAGISGSVVEITPDNITQNTKSVKATVSVPMNANSWGVAFFMKNKSIVAETELLTERAPIIQAQALPSNNVPPPPPSDDPPSTGVTDGGSGAPSTPPPSNDGGGTNTGVSL